MSRIGNRILEIPSNVEVSIDGNVVKVKGPKGELSTEMNKDIIVSVKDNTILVERKNENVKAFHGTANAMIANAIKGVTEGFEKKLEAIGVGYRFTLKGNVLLLNSGKSHVDEVEIPSDLKVDVTSNTEITIGGIDKQKVGQFAAQIRDLRRPEPYKGKGVRYKDETIRRKVGKKASK